MIVSRHARFIVSSTKKYNPRRGMFVFRDYCSRDANMCRAEVVHLIKAINRIIRIRTKAERMGMWSRGM